MLLRELVETSALVRQTRKRTEKIERLAELLSKLEGPERRIGGWLLCGRPRQGKVGIGYKTLSKLEVDPAPSPGLGLLELDHRIETMGSIQGPGSQVRRLQALEELLGAATREEQAFLRQVLVGELRQGALEGVLVEAVAKASSVDGDAIRRARMLCGDLGLVVSTVLSEGPTGLENFQLTPFVPVHPMLAATAERGQDALQEFGTVAVEWKLDGARAQVHRLGSKIKIYSRKLNEMHLSEIVDLVDTFPGDSFILDGEVLALDEAGRPLAFQTTMSRVSSKRAPARQLAFGFEQEPEEEVGSLALFCFDLLYLNGKSLIDEPAQSRWEKLDTLIPKKYRIPRKLTDSEAGIEASYAEALSEGHEGVMLKSTEASYDAGRRGGAWLKMKPAHTLDLVVLAAEWGSGRRKGWLSNLHLGCLGEKGEFVMLGKTFKGLSDELLRWQTEAFLERELRREDHVVYLRPELVVEIALDGLQASPHYPGGFALRFARVKRYRPDKSRDQASTWREVEELYHFVRGSPKS